MKSLKFAAALTAILASSAAAGEITVQDAYARVASKMSKSGAIFLQLHNMTDRDDRLIAVRSDVAKRVELHTHQDLGDGVMKMMEVEEGFAIPAKGMHALARGGDHIMLMGLTRSLAHGDQVTLTLDFETAEDLELTVLVDLERQDTPKMSSH